MSIEASRKKWASKMCPFGVAEKCVLDDCAAWFEQEAQFQTVTIYKESSFKPGMFSSWSIDETLYESEEVRVGGGEHTDVYETRSRVTGYRLKKETEELVCDGYGKCSRL